MLFPLRARKNSLLRAFFGAVCCNFFACSTMPPAGGKDAAAVPAPPEAPPPTKLEESPADVPTQPGPKEVALQASGTVRVEVQQLIAPRLRAQIAERDLASSRLLVRCPTAVCGAESGAKVFLQLDEHGPRPGNSARPLTSLLPEDQEIAPGGHLVSAFVLNDEALLIDSQRFFSVAKVSESPPSPRADELSPDQSCWMVLPQLTLNGPAAQNLELLSTVDPQVLSQLDDESRSQVKVSYTVEGQGLRATGTFPLGTKALVSAVVLFEQSPPGDLKVSAECILGQNSLGTAHRTVTLNPELSPSVGSP